MDSVIQWVATAMSMNVAIDRIHDILFFKGMDEDTIYLAIKAGEILYNARVDIYGEIL